MDKYEYRVKTEQMLEHMEHKRYKKAMEIADTIDWRRVKNPSMLNSVSEIYEYNGEFKKSRDVLFLAYDRAPGSRKTVYRLGTLALKINDIEEASDCYEEFVKLAPKDPNQYILKYKILKARRAPLSEQIDALEEFKKAEYIEKWAYELAKLYDEAGMTAECLEECDDLILWFSEGTYVYQAMELKMKYKPLTPLQQEKYNSQRDAGQPEGFLDEEDENENEADTTAPETSAEEESAEDIVAKTMAEATETESPAMDGTLAVEEPAEEEKDVRKVRPESNIRKAVKGATLAEALRNGIAVANGVDIERKAIDKKDEDLRITGQMKIEEILQEWEAKQKENAQAIADQKQKDEEALARKRQEAERRREEEARRIEEQQRAAEEARRIAEQKAAEEARRLAARKAEEERLLAEQRAEEERRQAILKAEEEERMLEKLAAGKAAQNLEERRKIQPEEEYEEEDFGDYEEDIEDADFDDYEENAGETDSDDYEESDGETDYEEGTLEADYDDYEEDFELDDEDFFAEPEEKTEHGGMTEDLRKLMEELEAGQKKQENSVEDEYDVQDEFPDEEDADFEDAFEEEEEPEEDLEEDYEEGDVEDYEDALPEEKDELTIEEPTEEEIQKRIKKGKGGVPFDTGFVVTGRYDLSATSEIGLRAGLTEEQKKLFSYFVPVRGMSEQIVEVLDNDRREKREGTSRTGNIMVIGQKGSGKTVLAVDIVKAIQKQRNLKQGKVAIVTGESLNKKELTSIFKKLRGGAIIVEKAGKLNARTVKELDRLMEKKTGELLFVLEDQRKPLEKLFTANPHFKKKFTSRLELPVFINDELVTFGQTYAKENGYKLDEMGILALYSRIDIMQREDHSVTVAEVKEIMDEAIDHSQKANVKHFARRVFGKGTDDADRIILKEDDFRI